MAILLLLIEFFLTPAVFPEGVPAPEMPARPDLDVTYMERLPRYRPGPWVYPSTGPQYLGIGNRVFTSKDLDEGEHKQWPARGEEVTFIAHVCNKSRTVAPPASFSWHIGDREIASGKLPPIPPWKEVTQSCTWKWQPERVAVRFEADGDGRLEEICEVNNRLEEASDALSLQMRVTPELYEAFHTRPNGLGSYSFEDWAQRHVRILNGVMAGCVYPQSAPNGILERIRIDQFQLMTKEEMATPPQGAGFDGGWNYYDDAFGKPGSWFDFHIRDDFTKQIDTGLLHELTHQIGIIDMYCIVVDPSWNHVRDEEGDLVLIGHHVRQPDMMGGGAAAVDFDGQVVTPHQFDADADGRVTVGPGGRFAAFSEETAGALNSMKGLRRGHFGLYLFDLPARSFLQILDNRGEPVAGASVAVHQQSPYPGPQSIPETPAYGGAAGPDGVFVLGSSPFGNVNCIGLNGTLLFVLRARGHTEYRILDVCHFNIAKWRGNRESWTAVFRTAIPPEGAPEPPRNLRWGVLRPQSSVLRWEASPSAGVRAYHVYRERTSGDQDAPLNFSVSFDSPYVRVATLPAGQTSCEVKPIPGYAGSNENAWFTVTAVDDHGRESAHARNKELVRWGPWGNATVEREDPETVKVTLPPGPAWIQVRNRFVVRRKSRLEFQVSTESQRNTFLRLNVAGVGPIDIPITGEEPENSPQKDLELVPDDGLWHPVKLNLREMIDRHAAEKQVTPAHGRTTWNEDWLVVECQFGDWTHTAKEEAEFQFQGLRLTE
ncbi:MAG: fibronectin type III domain-containing protein [Planctomycetes bacterium]|nr:fibronectin type III domain-containing protein [Planctomycetota bacterium]